jgi:hypothetical protein
LSRTKAIEAAGPASCHRLLLQGQGDSSSPPRVGEYRWTSRGQGMADLQELPQLARNMAPLCCRNDRGQAVAITGCGLKMLNLAIFLLPFASLARSSFTTSSKSVRSGSPAAASTRQDNNAAFVHRFASSALGGSKLDVKNPISAPAHDVSPISRRVLRAHRYHEPACPLNAAADLT